MKRFHATAVIWKEGRRYVSKCPELGVASFGRTPDLAHLALEEAVALYLENARALGILSDFEPALASASHYTAPVEITLR